MKMMGADKRGKAGPAVQLAHLFFLSRGEAVSCQSKQGYVMPGETGKLLSHFQQLLYLCEGNVSHRKGPGRP